MKCFYLFALFVLFTVSATESRKINEKLIENRCPFGESYFDGCKSCYCTTSGYVCTDRYCPPEEPIQICTPLDTKKQDCNTCTCDETGTMWLCTEMACLPSITGKG